MAHQWQPSQKNTKKYRAEIEAFGVPRGKVAQPRVTSDSWKPPIVRVQGARLRLNFFQNCDNFFLANQWKCQRFLLRGN